MSTRPSGLARDLPRLMLHLVAMVMPLVCFYLMCWRHGTTRFGGDDSRPEFSNFSWLAMLLSAGDDNAPRRCSIAWGLGEVFIAAALPIQLIMRFMAYGILRSLRRVRRSRPLISRGHPIAL